MLMNVPIIAAVESGRREGWIEPGEVNQDGNKRVIDKKGRIVAASNSGSLKMPSNTIASGDNADRAIKLFGVPDRYIQLTSGKYLAYDGLSLAIHIVNNRITNWFYFENTKTNQ